MMTAMLSQSFNEPYGLKAIDQPVRLRRRSFRVDIDIPLFAEELEEFDFSY